jgi:hypothetical protein
MKIYFNSKAINKSNIFKTKSNEYIKINNFNYIRVMYHEGDIFLKEEYLLYYTQYLKSNKPYFKFINTLNEMEKRLNN